MPPSSVVSWDETLPLFPTPAPEVTPPLIPMPTQAPVATDNPEHNGDEANQANQRTPEPVQGTYKTPPNILVIFPAITIGTFLAAADGTIALVSYATISSELDALNMASWVVTAYALAVASFQPLYGKLCDIFGCKECLLAAYTLFASGCLACGLSRSIEQLIAARVLQAVGGGGLGTIVSIMLTGLVPPEDRGVWQGILNIVYSLGAGLGAPLGGLLAGTVGWRWSFFGQVPICMLAIWTVSCCLGGDVGHTKSQNDQETLWPKLRRVDFLGSGSLIAMIAAFMFGLDRGSNVSWVAPATHISFFISVISAMWFFYVEMRIAREPILPPAVTFSAKLLPVYLASFLCFFAIIAMDFTLPLYYQGRHRLSPQQASFYMLPAIATGVCSSLLTGVWMRRTYQYYWALVLASALQIMGGLAAFLLSGSVRESMPSLIVSQAVSELGIGNAVVSGLMAVISNGSGASIAIVTAAYYAFRNLGSVLGVAVVSTVIQQTLQSILTVELQPYDLNVQEIVDEVRKSLTYLHTLDPEIAAIVRDCYGKAMNKAFLLIFIVAFIVIIPASRIRGGKTRRS